MPYVTPHHAIRDGDYPIIYVAGNDGLYKLFYQSGQIVLMKACAAGEQGHMVGYAGLVNPPTGYELIVLPYAATGAADRIWRYQIGTGWTGTTPPIAGRRWRGIRVARSNPNKWLIWGDARNGTTIADGAQLTSRSGQIVGAGDYLPAFWLTTDAGASWSAYNVPSGIAPSMDTHTFKDELIKSLFVAFTTASDHIAITASATGTGFDDFNRALTSVQIWRDAAIIWSDDPILRGGHPTGFSAGQDDDICMAAIFNTGGGGATEYRFGYVPTGSNAWQQVGSDYDNGMPTNYTGDYALDFAVEPGSRRAVARQAHALGPQNGTLLTSDYRSEMFIAGKPPSTRLQNTRPNAITWSRKGIITTGAHDLSTGTGPNNAGLLVTLAGDTASTSPSTELYTSYNRINSLTVARQRSQTAAAVRLDGSPYTTPAQFGIYASNQWTQIPGPTDAPGAQLAEAIAIIER